MATHAPLLTSENFAKGFLVDEELMAGVSENPGTPGDFLAFVLRPESGEYLGYQSFPSLEGALEAINRIPRDWRYEPAGGCKQGNCGKTGSCDRGCRGCALGSPA